MKGRKLIPTSRQVASGDPRKVGKRKLEQRLAAEPKAARGLPPCPRHLKGRARDAWNFWSEELAAMDLDKRPDAMLLEGACIAYSAVVKAHETLDKEGEERDGKTHPAVKRRDDALKLLRSYGSEFGFSPASRTRLAIEKQDESEADFAALLSGPRVKREAVN